MMEKNRAMNTITDYEQKMKWKLSLKLQKSKVMESYGKWIIINNETVSYGSLKVAKFVGKSLL